MNSVESSDLSAKTDRAAIFEPEFREDLRHWIGTDSKFALRIMTLVEHIVGSPFSGLRKPEPLKYELAGREKRSERCRWVVNQLAQMSCSTECRPTAHQPANG
jgi:Txe/YoeB family toxin of Txe-Axe toxin-antitoxin module